MLLQAAGYLFVFKLQQHEIRQEIKQQIKAGVPEGELVLFKLANDARPLWIIPDREFRANGGMYDVVRKEIHGDTTWYYCISDEKETQLFAHLDEAVQRDMNQSPARRQKLERIFQALSSLYLGHQQNFSFLDSAEEINFPADDFGLKTWMDSPPTPPPEA
jgi:heat shock protein HspQ